MKKIPFPGKIGANEFREQKRLNGKQNELGLPYPEGTVPEPADEACTKKEIAAEKKTEQREIQKVRISSPEKERDQKIYGEKRKHQHKTDVGKL